eukprot:TRINITY_DN17304_c0_g1_i1.p1 TRINITY_DN17304_c0_g1~~TRINITY_DN17304_c0_g1_i1.p1  ORF type:complete len:204 (-),score=43.60 TRINITY_DN17304_c0_g1_i1:61-672(-)
MDSNQIIKLDPQTTVQHSLKEELKTQHLGIMAYFSEEYEFDKENIRIFHMAMDNADPRYDRIYLFITLDLNEDEDTDIEKRKEDAKKYLYKFQDKLDINLYTWTYIISPTYDKNSKFEEVINKYKINKVIFPKTEYYLQHWLKKSHQGNVVGVISYDYDITNSPSSQHILTSTGTLQRKIHVNNKNKNKNKISDCSSLLEDFY